MQQHAVPLVRLRADVFKEKNAAAINSGSIRCAERLRKNRDTPTIQQTLGKSGPKNAKTVRDTKRPGTVTLKAVLPTCRIDTIIARKIRSDHRTVEGDKVRFVMKPAMERGVIAVTNEN